MHRAEEGSVHALLDDYRQYAGSGLWLALAVILLAALAEGFGLLMIVPLASIATGADQPHFGNHATFFGALSGKARLLLALALFVGAMAARSALLYARDVQTSRLRSGYETSLRIRAAATLAERGWGFASRIGQARMQSLLLNDVPRSGMAIAYAQQFGVAAVMLTVQLALTAFLSLELTGLALIVLLVGGAAATRWLRRGAVSGMAISESSAESTHSGFRLHAGLKAALAQGTVEPFLAEYRRTLEGAADHVVRFTRDHSSAQQLAALGAALTAALLLFVGVAVLALPFPVLIASLVLFARMSGPAQQLQLAAQNFAALAPSFAALRHRLGELLEPPAAGDPPSPLDWTELHVTNAGFKHRTGLGLECASFLLKRGEWIGLSGPSGSGKTTLVDLVAGLIAPANGSVTVDGEDLDGHTAARWRAGLAYLGQEGALFNDSVRGNLLAEGADCTDEQLWKMLETVGIAARIRAFPDGLDESVGDRGSQLSGGERQRLAIARALLRQPTLLILDEATAGLDGDGEKTVLEALRSVEPRPAALVVAHRDSTLKACDRVLRVRHGKIEQAGD